MKAAGCHVAGYEVIIYVASHLDVHAAYKVLVHAVVVDHGLGSHGRGRAHVSCGCGQPAQRSWS